MLSDLWRFLVELFEGDPKVLAAFIVGIIAGAGVLVWVWFYFLKGRPDAKIDRLEHALEQERATSAAFRSLVAEKDVRIRELSRACETTKEQLAAVDLQRQEAAQRVDRAKQDYADLKRKAIAVRDHYKQQVDLLTNQHLDVEKQQGRFWERPATAPITPFLPLAHRRMPIISLFNLKGGVGKTSITGHLGAALAAAGKRVLLIDLDYQASLTHLVLTPEQVSSLLPSSRHVHRLLVLPKDPSEEIWNLITQRGGPIRPKNTPDTGLSYVIAAHEELDRVEEMTKAKWLIKSDGGNASRDPRYALRAALHHPSLAGKFDYVLLDCPPRLSMACINGLTASDFILVPTLFDRTSRDAVGRLLELVKHLVLQQTCPELTVLGIVGNRSFCRPRLTVKEKNAWDQLQRDARDAWKAPVYAFRRHLPALKAFADAAEQRILADEQPELAQLFGELVTELEQQIRKRTPDHERTDSTRPAKIR